MHVDPALGPLEPPFAAPFPVDRHRRGRQLREILRPLDRPQAPHQLGRGHQHATAGAEGARHQRGAVLDLRPHAQRDVDALLDQVDRPVDHPHVDAHRRIALEEARQHLRQPAVRDRDRAAEPHQAAGLGLHLGHRLRGRARRVAHRGRVAQVDLAGRRERQPPRAALHQLHAELFLELGHAPRQPRLRNAQRPARGREAAALGHFGEEHHVVEVLHGLTVLFLKRCGLFLPTYHPLAPKIEF